MKRNKQGSKHVGFHLRVSTDGGQSFQRVGGIFESRYQAEQFRSECRPLAALPYRLEGVRLNFVPIQPRNTDLFEDRPRRAAA